MNIDRRRQINCFLKLALLAALCCGAKLRLRSFTPRCIALSKRRPWLRTLEFTVLMGPRAEKIKLAGCYFRFPFDRAKGDVVDALSNDACKNGSLSAKLIRSSHGIPTHPFIFVRR